MTDIPESIEIKNLPLTDDGRMRVQLVAMVTGDNPWRTREDYIQEQRRDTVRFWITIATLLMSLLGVVITAVVAMDTIRQVGTSEPKQIVPIAHSGIQDVNE